MDRSTEFKSKMELCVRTTQSGKTFTAISKISLEIAQDIELGRSIHFMNTMNTLLNNKQVAKRLDAIERTYGIGSVCVLSSQYDGKYRHVKSRAELQGICFDETTCPRVVVMCSNKRRYDDGVEFLKVIDRNKSNIERAFVYFDELHKYLTPLLRSQIEEIHELEIVKRITALTATPDKIFQEGFWSKIRLVHLDNFSELNYAGAGDMIFNCIDDYFTGHVPRVEERQLIGFIDMVLEKHDILRPGTYSFIPAYSRRASHESVRKLIFEKNEEAVVIVINGEEKTLQYKSGNIKTIPLIGKKLGENLDEEVCETIARLLVKHNLQGRPVVVTGFLCVGMGQTLTHPDIGPFTSAIIGHVDLSNDEIYQLFGRTTGRMKDWEKYVQTNIYCPTVVMNRCIVMEECARNMVLEYSGEIVTHEDYIEPMVVMGVVGQAALENIHIKKNPDIAKMQKIAEKEVRKALKDARERSKHVPYIFQTTTEKIQQIQRFHKGKEKNEQMRNSIIFEIVQEIDGNCYEIIQTYRLVRVVIPDIDTDTYVNNITKAIVAHREGRTFITALQKKDKEHDVWTCNIDLKHNQIIILTQKKN